MAENSLSTLVADRIEKSIAVKRDLLAHAAAIATVADLLVEAYRDGKKAIFFGNGGSAADSQHLAAEFLGRFYKDRRPLPAAALTVNTSTLTAIGNDYGYDKVFSRPLAGIGVAGDVAVGISTSGNSENVLAAFEVAKKMGIMTVALTGASGGKMQEAADYCIAIPSSDTPRIQECHILVGHILCEIVEEALTGNEA